MVRGARQLSAKPLDGRERVLNLDVLGNIGEAVGGLSVVVSLIYLAIQIRQNTRAVRATLFREGARSVNDYARTVLQDEATARIFLTGLREPDSLSQLDRLRFNFRVQGAVLNYQDSSTSISNRRWKRRSGKR
jgi:hypothetical protein